MSTIEEARLTLAGHALQGLLSDPSVRRGGDWPDDLDVFTATVAERVRAYADATLAALDSTPTNPLRTVAAANSADPVLANFEAGVRDGLIAAANPIKAAGDRLQELAPWAEYVAVSYEYDTFPNEKFNRTGYAIVIETDGRGRFGEQGPDLAALVAQAEGWIAERTLSAEATEPGPSPT